MFEHHFTNSTHIQVTVLCVSVLNTQKHWDILVVTFFSLPLRFNYVCTFPI